MRRVILLTVSAALAIALAWWIAALPGKVSLSVAGLSIETSASVALVLGAAGLLALYIVFRVLWAIITLPAGFRLWGERRRRRAGDVAVTRALVTLAAAEGKAARKAAAKARKYLGDTPQTLLLAAEAARQEGDEDGAAKAFTAMLTHPDAAFLGLRGLFRQALAKSDWPEAQRLAREAEAIQPGVSWLRQARLELAARTGDWAPALPLAGPDAPLAMLAVAASESTTDKAESERLARRAFRADPAFVPGALAYARHLRAAGREGKALDVLREAWTNTPHPDIATLALEPLIDPLARVRAATALIRARAEHPEAHLLMGRLSLAAGLVGEARRHAKAALALGPSDRRVWLLIADVEEAEHTDPAALREALRQAAAAAPGPAWLCSACHAEHADWHPACPTCHAPATLAWGRNPRALAIALPASPAEPVARITEAPQPD